MDNESIAILQRISEPGEGWSGIENEEACANNRKLLRINGEKHDEMLLPLTPLSVLIYSYGA
jgi:hypothetical protein